MSLDDALRTPAFSRVMQGSARGKAPGTGLSRRLVLTFATLCVVVITLAIVTLRRDVPVVNDEQDAAQTQSSESLLAPPVAVSQPSVSQPSVSHPSVKKAVIRVRHRKPVNELAPVNELVIATMLSTWRSPTDSLLKSSGDDKLMSLPKLGESLKALRFYSLDDDLN
jgi:hypothetical protein